MSVAEAMRWERRLYTAAHPVAYPFLRGVGRLGPAVRVAGVGVVVNDAGLAKDVLCDTESFAKNGPGSSGALWTPVLGPSVLLNMEGAEHRRLRAALAGLFTPAAAEAACERVLGRLLELTADRLDSGGAVDLVRVTRIAAAAVISDLIGLGPEAGGRDGECGYLELFARGEEIVGKVGLRTRELSPDVIAAARRVLAEVTAPAARAYRSGGPVTAMGRLRDAGLSEAEALGAAGAFFLTGTETVATTVPRLIALLVDLGVDTGDGFVLDRAVDEAMRVMAPTPVMLRRAVAPIRLGRVRVRAGDRIVIATHTCARALGPLDPEVMRAAAAPAEPRRIVFGAGPHTCIGAPLALAEIRALARTVLGAQPLRIMRRQAARGVLIPTYRVLEVARR